MLYRDFKVKALEQKEDGVFTGYLAIFNIADSYNDIILPGAFTKTLQEKKGRVPLLDEHRYGDPSARLGYLQLEEDAKGLRVVEGRINLAKPEGQRAWQDIVFYQQNQMPLGLSIGYDVIADKVSTTTDGNNTVRYLQEIQLWEGSLVMFPAMPLARVEAASSIAQQLLGDKKLLQEVVAELQKHMANLQVDANVAEPQSHSEDAKIIDLSWFDKLRNELKY
jgi:HK97 family phage prohead protease